MKRSEINSSIKNAITFFQKHNYSLPPFAFFSPKEWDKRKNEYYQRGLSCFICTIDHRLS